MPVRRTVAAAVALAALSTLPAAGQSPTSVPVCVNQATAVNSRCERWAREFNDKSPDGSVVSDTPAGFAVSPKGDRLFVATTTKVGAARARITVAALSAKNGGTLWIAHPQTQYTTSASALTLTPDGRTVVVVGTLTYLPNLNASPLTWVFTSAYDAATGRARWTAVDKRGGVDNRPVAVRTSPRGDRVYVSGYSVYSGYARAYVEWVTLAYDTRGRELWRDRYGGQKGGQNFPVGLAVAPRGDVVYVAGSSDHPQTTGQFSNDYSAIALDARTGRRRWTSVTRGGSDHRPAAVALNPRGDRLYLTGTGTFGTATQPVEGAYTVALSTANGKASWTSRYLGQNGLSASGTGIVASPKGDRVYVTAAVGSRKQVVADVFEPSVVSLTTIALDAARGKQAWAAAYAPDPGWSAAPTAVTVNPQGSTVYVAGIVGPPTLAVAYPVVLAVTSGGAMSWVARYDVRDPGSAGVTLAGFPAVPLSILVDRTGGTVYTSLAYYPALTGAASTECGAAHSAGVGQDCDPTGSSDLVLAYAK